MKKGLYVKLIISLLALFTVIIIAALSGNKQGNGNGNHENLKSDDDILGFVYKGTAINLNDKMSDVVALIGEPDRHYETNSCAYQGMEGVYTYQSFEINTFNHGDGEKIVSITFLNDLVSTKDGVSIGNLKEVAEAKYGTPDRITDTSYFYDTDDAALVFIFDGNKIISIQYKITAGQ